MGLASFTIGKQPRMEEQPQDQPELNDAELEEQDGEELPSREALSIVDVGDSLGPPPGAE
jgi:hypothetical protein